MTYINSHIAELAWAIGAPSLMAQVPNIDVISSRQCADFLSDSEVWLTAQDAAPQALLDELARLNSWKVGMESLGYQTLPLI